MNVEPAGWKLTSPEVEIFDSVFTVESGSAWVVIKMSAEELEISDAPPAPNARA